MTSTRRGMRSGSGGRLRMCMSRGRGQHPQSANRKLDPTHVILSSSHAKKLAVFWTRISALGLESNCTTCSKRVTCMCISCRRLVDVHKGRGLKLMWTHVKREGGQKYGTFCECHKWMTPYC